MYATLTGAFRNDVAFATVYNFLFYLKADHPGQATAIANRALIAGIANTHDRFDGPDYWLSSTRRYTTVPANGVAVGTDIDGDPCQTSDNNGPITQNYHGNTLYNRLNFKTTCPCWNLAHSRHSPQ